MGYRVRISRVLIEEVYSKGYIEVEAPSEDEAERLAEDRINEVDLWEEQDRNTLSDTIEIQDAEQWDDES